MFGGIFFRGMKIFRFSRVSSVSTFDALGEAGWFFGDFFIDELPKKLYYHGKIHLSFLSNHCL
jgi:hypothetical protein